MNRVSSHPERHPATVALDLFSPATVRVPPIEAEDTEVGFALHLEDLFDDEISFDDFDLDLP